MDTHTNEHDQPRNPDRRNFFKVTAVSTGAAVTGAALLSPATRLFASDEESKSVTPFVDDLPIPAVKQTVAALLPPTAKDPLIDDGECGRAENYYLADFPPQKFYELQVKEGRHRWHRDYPEQRIVGYDGVCPGPTFIEDYGVPSVVRLHNLVQPGQGFGVPEISMHVHNLHTPSDSDGFPGDFFSSRNAGPTLSAAGRFKDHHYLQQRAGFLAAPHTFGDPNESLGTLWYHDHCLDFTTGNVYAGMAGMYVLHDELDTGLETEGLRLPSGDYDVPLVLADKRFSAEGYLTFDPLDNDGHIGDRYTVNGKIQPKFKVFRRRYRFRVVDGGPSRIYQLGLLYGSKKQGFTYIGNDGNLLPNPILNMQDLVMGVAERADIIVDFSRFPTGSRVFLVNRMEQKDGRGPTGKILSPGDRLLRFDVGTLPPEPDASAVLTATTPLRPLPDIDLSAVVAERTFSFKRSNSAWVVNDKFFDVHRADARIRRDSAEIWTLENTSGSWWHPIHIHFEEGRLLSRNGKAPPPHERGRKDVYTLRPGESVRVFLRFRDCPGKYVMHCHNTAHEDHAMMMRWDIED